MTENEALYVAVLEPAPPAVLVSYALLMRLVLGVAEVDAEFLYAELDGGLRVRALRPRVLEDRGAA
jgi:hypothetical protein